MRLCGYSYNTVMGENIAAGYATAQAVFTGWKNSPGHNANMLNGSYRVIGIGLVTGGSYGEYWTTDFGGYVDPSAHDPGSASSTTTTPRPVTTTTTARHVTTTTTARPVTTITTARHATTTTTAPAPTTTTTAPPVRPSFRDVRSNSTFYAAVNSLAAAGVVSGYADGSFRPADPVTRAQFAKIIVLATGGYGVAPAATQATFPDVPFTGASYPFDFVEEAVALGIIQGYDDGLFGPGDNVTRAQIAIMVVRSGERSSPSLQPLMWLLTPTSAPAPPTRLTRSASPHTTPCARASATLSSTHTPRLHEDRSPRWCTDSIWPCTRPGYPTGHPGDLGGVPG